MLVEVVGFGDSTLVLVVVVGLGDSTLVVVEVVVEESRFKLGL